MEGKRILPWTADADGLGRPCLRARTLFGLCDVYEDNSWCVYDIESDDDADSQDAAIDACESAYIKACTEFLSLYNPATHIVLSREASKTLYRIMTALASVANDEGYTKIAAELLAALEVGE